MLLRPLFTSKKISKKPIFILLTLGAYLMLLGCGNKSALYLPTTTPEYEAEQPAKVTRGQNFELDIEQNQSIPSETQLKNTNKPTTNKPTVVK